MIISLLFELTKINDVLTSRILLVSLTTNFSQNQFHRRRAWTQEFSGSRIKLKKYKTHKISTTWIRLKWPFFAVLSFFFLYFFGQWPEGADDLCFHIGGNFLQCTPPLKFQSPSSNHSLKAQIPISRLKSQSQGSNPSLEAQIPVLKLKSKSRGSNLSPEGQVPVSWFKSQSWG